MNAEEIEAIIDRAAERGATRALEKVGLHDDKAGRDIGELRDLLDMWREARRGMARTIGKIIGTAILVGLAVMAGLHWPGGK